MRHYRHVAVAYLNKSPVFGYNSLKTDPKFIKFSNDIIFSSSHAEMQALIKVRRHLRHKVILYVVRFTNDNHYTMSKPCTLCQMRLRDIGIPFRNVYYTGYDGMWYRLSDE